MVPLILLPVIKGRLTKREQRQVVKDHAGMLDVIDILRNWDTEADREATPNRITSKSPFGVERTRSLLAKLFHAGEVTRKPITIKGNQTHEYSLSNDAEC